MTFQIGNRPLGPKHPPYIIAEISGNHGGSLEKALAIVDAVANTGADAVKLQTYRADTMTIRSKRPEFRLNTGLWAGQTLYDLYQKAHTPWEWHEPLFNRAKQQGLTIFSTPFDNTAVDFLLTLGIPCFKVASFEIVDIPLVEKVAKTGKPIIISTGMATPEEIDEAVAAAQNIGNQDICLLHCTSAYPASMEDLNLVTIQDMATRYKCLVGLSDHSLGTTAAVTATALGACVIEKHVTLDRNSMGVDNAFSIEPDELKQLVAQTQAAHAALGHHVYQRGKIESDNRCFRRSLYTVKPLRAGDTLKKDAIRSIRPANGLSPKFLKQVLGCRIKKDVAAGQPLLLEMLEKSLE